MIAGIDVLTVTKGDTLIVWFEHALSATQQEAIAAQFRKALPEGVDVAVVGPGLRLSVVKSAA